MKLSQLSTNSSGEMKRDIGRVENKPIVDSSLSLEIQLADDDHNNFLVSLYVRPRTQELLLSKAENSRQPFLIQHNRSPIVTFDQ